MKCIVLSSGGIYGAYMLGILSQMENTIMNNVNYYAGTSIGAVLCTLFICGYTLNDIYKFLKTTSFQFKDEFNIKDLFENYGLIENSCFFETLETLIGNTTFIELYEKSNKTLVITGTNITCGICEYFSHTTTPNMKVINAIQITCSVPFLFTRKKYNNNYYVDGCVLDFFPYKYMIQTYPEVLNETNILGFYIKHNTKKDTDIVSFFSNIIYLMMHNQVDKYSNHVYILENITNVNMLEYTMDEVVQLYNEGITWFKENVKEELLC